MVQARNFYRIGVCAVAEVQADFARFSRRSHRQGQSKRTNGHLRYAVDCWVVRLQHQRGRSDRGKHGWIEVAISPVQHRRFARPTRLCVNQLELNAAAGPGLQRGACPMELAARDLLSKIRPVLQPG